MCDYCGLITDCLILRKEAVVRHRLQALTTISGRKADVNFTNRQSPKSGRIFVITQMLMRNQSSMK